MSNAGTPLLSDKTDPTQQPTNQMEDQKSLNDPEKQQINPSQDQNTDNEEGRSPIISILISLIIIGINIGISFATKTYYECAVSFGINWLSFLCIAWPFHTEKYYDFTGMISFLSVDIFSILYHKVPWNIDHIRNIVLFFMVMVWTLRLGLFLFKRITDSSHKGRDSRFDNLRNNFFRFAVAWNLQATWAYFCCMPLFVSNSINNNNIRRMNVNNITPLDIVGWVLWVCGWVIEIISDRQKTKFKNNPSNKGKFCNVGLWSVSRHPNYFGEITLWIGIFISAASITKNAGWLIVLSPVWTIILLVFSSGIPLAERTSMKKYGEQEAYQQYVKNVSVLIPLPCCWKGYI